MKYTNLIIILVFALFLVYPTSAEPAPYIEQGDNTLSGVDGLIPTGWITASMWTEPNGDTYLYTNSWAPDAKAYKRTGGAWVENTAIINGLTEHYVALDLWCPAKLEVFFDSSGNKRAVVRHNDGSHWSGFDWNGTGWEENAIIVSGLTSISCAPDFTIFTIGSDIHLIAGDSDGAWYAKTWNGTGWDDNAILKNGLTDGVPSDSWIYPMVFKDLAGTTRMYVPNNNDDLIYEYTWNGAGWDNDGAVSWDNNGYFDTIMAFYEGSNNIFVVRHRLDWVTSIITTYAYEYIPPVTLDNLSFVATITSTQNTVLEPGTLDFGDMTAGNTNTIEPTFTLNNTGNLAANVTAAFTTNVGGIYGLINTTHVIAGTNFSLQSATQTYTPLGATVSGVMMADNVPANTAEAWNAHLVIPAGQHAMIYTGTIQITFS